ncbi:MAG: SDR family oxidoreductase [Actinomycetota bacterium]|nr:SDR family oxidoreductase [Actinomycetota bacterium]
MGELDGSVAVVTGGASGMGAAMVATFVEEGARVVVADLDEDRGSMLAKELGDDARFLRTDVTRESDVAAALATAVDEWGGLDVLCNNAGFGGARGPLESISEDDYDITFDVLVKSVFFGLKHATEPMRRRGGGSIVNTASVAGLQAGEAPHLYSVAKAAVIHLTKTAALELGEHGIRVNAICPGVITTPLAVGRPHPTDEQFAKFRERVGPYQPIGRVGEPDDIAQAALYLASPRSGFVTGTSQVVDGGAFAGRSWSRQNRTMTGAAPIRMYRPPGR